MLLGKAQVATTQFTDCVDELLREAKYAATDIFGRTYLLSKIFELEGNIYFNVDRNRSAEAYLQCL